MNWGQINELTLGLLAGACVLISYLFTNQVKLRIINLAGSFLFVCYGVMLVIITNLASGWTTVILNTICFITHLVWLIRYKQGKIIIGKPETKTADQIMSSTSADTANTSQLTEDIKQDN